MSRLPTALSLVLLTLTPSFAQAQVKFVGKFGVWEAHRAKVAGEAVCYVATIPAASSRKVPKRAEVALMVSYWPKDRLDGQIKVAAGFPLKKDSKIKLRFSGKQYQLWVKGQNGWAADRKADRAIVRLLEVGKKLAVTSAPAAGAPVTDTFSLTGFTKAWAAAKGACAK